MHTENGGLKTFDSIIANPPFSQNYRWAATQQQESFHFHMPEKGKANFMFVQHMVASLNNAGRMAVVMPYGVLFLGGDERKFREWLIRLTGMNDRCFLEAVIGLPSALFYGTGIRASVIIFNNKDAHLREKVLFINADREYKEGKNQNKLRPENLEKIAFTYRNKQEIHKYSKLVNKAELAAEEYNLIIRRFVDNAPPPEPHDAHAHLKGGIPESEVNSIISYFYCYKGLKNRLFESLKDNYLKVNDTIKTKKDIKKLFDESNELKTAHALRVRKVHPQNRTSYLVNPKS